MPPIINNFLRYLFFASVVRFVVIIVLGLNVRHREKLPLQGPAILVANHNSHLDTMVLMTLLPLKLLHKVRPVAAMDYFLRTPLLAWFALNIIGVLPVSRRPANIVKESGNSKEKDYPLAACGDALEKGEILIFFPEGSRGEPEKMQQFKNGIARLALQYPHVPVHPIFLHGLGKALPKGESLLVPFFCDIFVGDPLPVSDSKSQYMETLGNRMQQLAHEGHYHSWE